MTVDIQHGTPRIGLTVGTAATTTGFLVTKTAGYLRGSGSRRLVFAYEVQASDTDMDGVSVPANSLVRNGGLIVNSDGFWFRLSHEALTDNTDHKVNGAVTPPSGGVCGRTAQVRAWAAGAGPGEQRHCRRLLAGDDRASPGADRYVESVKKGHHRTEIGGTSPT